VKKSESKPVDQAILLVRAFREDLHKLREELQQKHAIMKITTMREDHTSLGQN